MSHRDEPTRYFRRCFYCSGVFTTSSSFRQHRDRCYADRGYVRSVMHGRNPADTSLMGRSMRNNVYRQGRRSTTSGETRWPPLQYLAAGVEAMIDFTLRERGVRPLHQLPAIIHQIFSQFPEEMRIGVLRGCMGASFDLQEGRNPARHLDQGLLPNIERASGGVGVSTQTEDATGPEDVATVEMDVDRWSELLRLELEEGTE